MWEEQPGGPRVWGRVSEGEREGREGRQEMGKVMQGPLGSGGD